MTGVQTCALPIFGFHEIETRYCYRSGDVIPVDLSNPATEADGLALISLCDMLPYHENTLKWIVPAAIFLGPICGIMDYRPGLWVDGEKGSGKSTLYSEFFANAWRGCSFMFTGGTSEPGIRQKIGSDALPVQFDEAEARNQRAAQRLDAVLELIRQSSTETGGRIVKGSANGSAISYEIRSIFALFSIAAPAMETADESRMARVTLTANHSREQFDKLRDKLAVTLGDPAFCMRLRARAILNAAAIRESYELFRRVISEVAKDSRKGQQFGTYAAAYWHLQFGNKPPESLVRRFVAEQPWANMGAGTETESDHQQ